MKRIFAVFMIAIMLCLFSVAVFAEGESIIGRTFTLTDEGGNVCEVKILDETRFYVQISQDGSMLGTYTLNGEYITLLVDDKVFENYKIIGDAIVYEEQPAPEAPNVFDRLWEYVVKNKDMTAELIFSTAILVILWTIKKIQNGIKTDLKTSNSNSANVADSQSGVVGVVNTMIDGYNGFKKDFETTIKSDEERDKQMAAILVTNTAILEIMSRVFPNSKQLPQGVKDVVNMTYANAVKIINDDQQLANLVANSKNLLAAGTEKAASDEEAV